MTMKVGMRDLARNSNLLDGYDYVDVEDKKTHEYKGLLTSPKYAQEIKEFLENKLANEKQKKIDRIMKFAGSMEMEDRYKGKENKELMEEVAKVKSGS